MNINGVNGDITQNNIVSKDFNLFEEKGEISLFDGQNDDYAKNSIRYTGLEKPDTQEYKAHDEYMKKIEEEYIKNHPAPEVSKKPKVFMGIAQTPGETEYIKWVQEKNEYMKAQEVIYRSNNPEYAKQAQEYEEQLERSILLC